MKPPVYTTHPLTASQEEQLDRTRLLKADEIPHAMEQRRGKKQHDEIAGLNENDETNAAVDDKENKTHAKNHGGSRQSLKQRIRL